MIHQEDLRSKGGLQEPAGTNPLFTRPLKNLPKFNDLVILALLNLLMASLMNLSAGSRIASQTRLEELCKSQLSTADTAGPFLVHCGAAWSQRSLPPDGLGRDHG